MNTKRIISFILVICLFISVMPTGILNSFAATPTSGTTGDCTWTLDGTVLTISGNGAMEDYTSSNPAPWGTDITTAYIQDGVTSIGDHAFTDCQFLTSASIPDSVTSIGKSAFSWCSFLSNINIPNRITSIEDYTFIACGNLRNISIPNNITSIGELSFSGCSRLNNITIPNSVKIIKDYAFENCSNLSNITIFDGLVSIGNGAFLVCSALTNIVIPNSVTTIGQSVFRGCKNLVSVTMPKNIASIEGKSFYQCSSLVDINIPDSVTTIGEDAFYQCSNLVNVNIPNSITTIGEGAFSYCSSLTNIIIPDNATIIGEEAFRGCSSLTKVTIPERVTSIGDWAFCGCSSLTKVTIENGVKIIGESAFKSCEVLTNVIIPYSIIFIGDSAFTWCHDLIISGYDNSYAENYAKNNAISFVSIGEIPEATLEVPTEPTDESTGETPDVTPEVPSEPTPEEPTEEEVIVGESENIQDITIESDKIDAKVDGDSVDLVINDSKGTELELYADPNMTQKIDGNVNMVEQIIKVYAKEGDKVYTVTLSKEATEYDFADLKEGAWYIPYVDTATSLGIIRGSAVNGETLLKPEDKATRIEGVIFALRMLGIDSTQFSDVNLSFTDYNAEGEWSANYVKAAVSLGLMKGSEVDGKLYLNGNNSISRQEFFAIFSRAMQITDKDESYKETDLSKFVDKDKIAPWFVDNIKYLVHNKIVDGNPVDGGYIINPEGQILRCEIIKMVTAALTE